MNNKLNFILTFIFNLTIILGQPPDIICGTDEFYFPVNREECDTPTNTLSIQTYLVLPNDDEFEVNIDENDPQWNLDSEHLQMEDAWEFTTGDPNIVLAIIDSGTDYNHEDLRKNIWINPCEDINDNGIIDGFDDLQILLEN